MVPGEIAGPDDPIEINAGRPVLTLRSRTPATGRSRSARTTTSPRPTRRCRSIVRQPTGMRLDVPGRHRRALRTGHRRPTSTSCRSWVDRIVARPARRRSAGAARTSGIRASSDRIGGPLPGAVRPDHRRPHPPRRHRPVDRGHRGPLRRRRRGRVRRRQGDPRVDGPVARHPRRRHARPRDHRRRHPRPLGHRQGRHRRARRSHRRHRQGRQPRHDGRRPPGARDRPRRPRSWPATARSSPPAPSTATST